MYVSLVEIFVKSYAAFQNAGYAESDSYTIATACLFGGIVIGLLIHLV